MRRNLASSGWLLPDPGEWIHLPSCLVLHCLKQNNYNHHLNFQTCLLNTVHQVNFVVLYADSRGMKLCILYSVATTIHRIDRWCLLRNRGLFLLNRILTLVFMTEVKVEIYSVPFCWSNLLYIPALDPHEGVISSRINLQPSWENILLIQKELIPFLILSKQDPLTQYSWI